jgi:hypothetical protein
VGPLSALALFSLATAVSFHSNFADQNQMINFLKNMMMAGGLLQIVAFGAGALSIDNRSGIKIVLGSASVCTTSATTSRDQRSTAYQSSELRSRAHLGSNAQVCRTRHPSVLSPKALPPPNSDFHELAETLGGEEHALLTLCSIVFEKREAAE